MKIAGKLMLLVATILCSSAYVVAQEATSAGEGEGEAGFALRCESATTGLTAKDCVCSLLSEGAEGQRYGRVLSQ